MAYRARRYEHAEPQPADPQDTDADPPDLRTHDGLNAAAEAAGHTWSANDLTANQKRHELADL